MEVLIVTLWLFIRIVLYIFIGICILVGVVKLIQDEEFSKPAFIFAILAFLVTLLPVGNIAEDYDFASTDYQAMSTPSPELPELEAYAAEPEHQLPLMEYILLGTWQGEYTAGQGRTSLQLIITEYTNGSIYAYFYFSAHPENPNVPSGLYSMIGSISDDMIITLTGQEWIERPGTFGFINIYGNLDIDNMVISSNEASLLVSKVSNDTTLRHNAAVITDEEYIEQNPSITILQQRVNDSGTFRAFSDTDESFFMFGQEYFIGFTIRVAASFNMWGGGTQYTVFTVRNLSDMGDYFNMSIGHVDGSGNGNAYVRVFLDKTTADGHDYEFFISSQVAPLFNQRISINGRNSMIIQVVNTSGNVLAIGFADLSIENN